MSSNPGHEGALPHEEHGEHEDAGIGRFFFGRVPEGVHGGLKQYGLLAIFLAIVTLVEFLIIVPEGLQGSSVVIAPPREDHHADHVAVEEHGLLATAN